MVPAYCSDEVATDDVDEADGGRKGGSYPDGRDRRSDACAIVFAGNGYGAEDNDRCSDVHPKRPRTQ